LLKIKTTNWTFVLPVEGREFYAPHLTKSNAQPRFFKPGLGNQLSGPRAGDIGYPQW